MSQNCKLIPAIPVMIDVIQSENKKDLKFILSYSIRNEYRELSLNSKSASWFLDNFNTAAEWKNDGFTRRYHIHAKK